MGILIRSKKGINPMSTRGKRMMPPACVDRRDSLEKKNIGHKRGRGPTLYEVIQKTLNERSPTGSGTRRDEVADAFVRAAALGSFVHTKEILDREEGRVPARLANSDGSNIKLYEGMPTEGESAP